MDGIRPIDGKPGVFGWKVAGSIDAPSVDVTVADHLTIALMAATVIDRSLVLDLSNVNFMDSAGLSVIVEARNRIAELGGELVVRCPQPQAKSLLEMTAMDNFSIVYD